MPFGSEILQTPNERVAAMSTLELCASLHGARSVAPEDDVVPIGPRLLLRMEREWDDRPVRDRVAAEAALRARADANGGMGA